MNFRICALVLFAVLSITTAGKGHKMNKEYQMFKRLAEAPSFCKGLDCPSYTVIDSNDDYETRQYEATDWITTTKTTVDLDSVRSKLYLPLLRYIEGANDAQEELPTAVPVGLKITPGGGPTTESEFTMSVFLAPSSDGGHPEPTEDGVSIATLEATTFYVASFGGHVKNGDHTCIKELKKLVQKLEKDGKAIDKTSFFTAAYDTPWTLEDRHNEVWVKAAN